jgi:DNA-binding winged helix-turn-helix (wHTH) protein/tetratricopeptide (TPR) repeat protein
MSHASFVFDDCALRVDARELRVRGAVRALEKRPFDVLAHLVAQRHRAVSRDELLRAFWPADAASASALSRAVMKIRRALDPAPGGGSYILTHHRSGYRFVGELASDAALGADDALAVALLPFANETGLPDLDWVELGLVSLVARELGADARLRVLPIGATLSALQSIDPAVDMATRAAALARLLGARRVVHAAVHVDAAGFHVRATTIEGDLRQVVTPCRPDPADLAGALAHGLQASWFPGHPPVRASAAVDPHASTRRLFARALQASSEQQWSRALPLLEAVLAQDPAHVDARRECLRALVALDDNRAFTFGEALLRPAGAPVDAALQAAVHLELAQAYVRRRLTSRAKSHLDAALQHHATGAATVDLLATTLLRASIAMSEFDFGEAQRHLERAGKLCDVQGGVFERIRLTCLRVIHEAETGDMAAAYAHARTAASLYRDHGVMTGHSRALCTLANASASLGRFSEAVRHGEAAHAMSRSLGIPTDTAVAIGMLSGLYRILRRLPDLERCIASLEEIDTAGSPRSDLFHLVSRAQLAFCRGEPGAAVRFLAEARADAEAAGQLLELHFVLPLLASALVGADHLIDAEQVCRQIERLPRFSRDRNLQAAWHHCEAQLAHALGDADEALARLRLGIEIAPRGYWQAHARLDAAWLCLEAGRRDEAAALVEGLGDWMTEHPVGQLVAARLLFQAGRTDEAVAAQWRLAGATQSPALEFLDAVAAAYANGTALPVAARLASWV